jgi:glutamate---cysteine ligase / carboxylate-amine ligase
MSSDRDYTIGCEEEFFLADARSLRIARRMSTPFLRDCRERMGARLARELLQSQIETNTSVCASIAELGNEMRQLRNQVIAAADTHQLAVVASGTFPTADWDGQVNTSKARYRRMLEDFQIIGRRNLLCGLHVHVAPPAGVDRIELMNRALPWLPLFLALSASSPFWRRERSGLMSYRQAAYDEWPRTGIPDHFENEADYAGFVARLTQSGIIENASYLWWTIRPSMRYPTVELRICDMCPRIDDAIALAALFRCLLRMLVRRADLGRSRNSMTRLLIDENRWLAKRHGVRAQLVDIGSGERRPVSSWLQELSALVAEDAAHFGCQDQIASLATIVEHGSSADQQLAIFQGARDAGASRLAAGQEVVRSLIAQTRAGLVARPSQARARNSQA